MIFGMDEATPEYDAEAAAAAEAKRKAAEEEARRKAEEEARRKAEAEAKRKAEDEAKRKAAFKLAFQQNQDYTNARAHDLGEHKEEKDEKVRFGSMRPCVFDSRDALGPGRIS